MSKFNLEAFKAGQKAKSVWGEISFLAVASNGRIVFECDDGMIDNNPLSFMTSDYEMVSRHQHLIDSYDQEDTWQYLESNFDEFATFVTIDNPSFDDETGQYRLHPHNDLIKAHKNGAKIEVFSHDGVSEAPYWYDDPNPVWDSSMLYRIMPKQTTKTVYEWMFKSLHDNNWNISRELLTEEAANRLYGIREYIKTGRSWEVEV